MRRPPAALGPESRGRFSCPTDRARPERHQTSSAVRWGTTRSGDAALSTDRLHPSLKIAFPILVIGAVIIGLAVLSLLLQHCHPVDPGRRAEVETQARVQEVASGVTGLGSPAALGSYPSASPSRLPGVNGDPIGLDDGNETNRGIESLFVALHLKGLAIRIDLPDDAIGNTDGDSLSPNPTQLDITERLEIVDAWGNPLAYFSAADYAGPGAYSKIRMGEELGGETVVAKPWKRRTGLYINPKSFQLFSAGPDGIFNTEDDIGNWVHLP